MFHGGSGHGGCAPSGGGGGKKDDTVIALLFLFVCAAAAVSLGLSALTAAMITSSIVEARNRARFDAHHAQKSVK